MTYSIVYKSNGARIGDGLRVMRVSEGGQKLEILTDRELETFSEIVLRPDEPVNPPVEPPSGPIINEPSGVVSGLDIVGNRLISWEGANPSGLANKRSQGVGLFDGWFDDLRISENIIITEHWHGISVYGCRRALIEGNKVFNINGREAPGGACARDERWAP